MLIIGMMNLLSKELVIMVTQESFLCNVNNQSSLCALSMTDDGASVYFSIVEVRFQ